MNELEPLRIVASCMFMPPYLLITNSAIVTLQIKFLIDLIRHYIKELKKYFGEDFDYRLHRNFSAKFPIWKLIIYLALLSIER